MSGGVEITIEGLEVFAHHGLLEEERRLGQVFLFDLYLLLDDCRGCDSDEIGDTVDYADVAGRAVSTATATSYKLLEKLAEAVAQQLLADYAELSRVGVRVAKPAAPMPHAVESVSVYVERSREPAEPPQA